MLSRWRYYLFSFAATLATAIAGGIASGQSQSFYQQLDKPTWAPPAQLFGPVWTVLYILIAVSVGMALSSASKSRGTMITIALIQFVLNALWTWIFFVFRNGALAFADIVALCIFIILLIVMFWRVSRVASLMLLPYLVWVMFASALNYSIWRANPGLL